MTKPMHPLTRATLLGLPVALPAAAVCVAYLDEPLALAIDGFRRSSPFLNRYTDDLPDLLLPFVLILSAWMWTAWFLRVRRGFRDERAAFYRFAGTVLPAAHVAKAAFKTLFGRVETRAWLRDPLPDGFHWFNSGNGHSGFPSGHMTVIAAVAAACWIHFPEHRPLLIFAPLLLGAALVVTNYHFLGDVVAGGYLGLAVAAAIRRALERYDSRAER
ncbi:MAG: phosphatase PAP2 family protein [Thermodesulfobacteriota bacterium]